MTDQPQTKLTARENWHELFQVNQICSFIPPERMKVGGGPWPALGSREHNQIVCEKVIPVLIDSAFFERTPFKSLSLFLNLCEPLDVKVEPTFRTNNDQLWVETKFHYDEFGHMTEAEFANFEIAVAARVILAACGIYNLDRKPAQKLVAEYPLHRAEVSYAEIAPTIELIEPPAERTFQPLTDQELVFSRFNPHSWCVNPIFTEAQIKRINPETLNVCVPMGMATDQYVEIANAMLRAPHAALRIQGCDENGYSCSEFGFIKHFKHVSRVVLESGQFTDLSKLDRLSPDLVRLELDLLEVREKPSLDVLSHFKNLQSLSLRGHYEDLAKFSNLKSLKALKLSEVKIDALPALTHLVNLQSLVLRTSKIKDISALPTIGKLKYLELVELAKLVSLDSIKQLTSLEYLELSGLNNFERLPSCEDLVNLKRVSLTALTRLRDLTTLAKAPALEELILFKMRQIQPMQVECFLNHPTLSAVRTDSLPIEERLERPRRNTGRYFQFN